MKVNDQIKVVIADDEKSIRDGLKNSVAWEELNTSVIDVVSDGKQAFDSILENKPDICIIDICMPELTGLEVIKMCKKEGIDTEFLILSGYSDFTYAQEAIRCGAKGYLLKPINLEKLMSELYNLCSYIINKKSLNINIDQLRKTSKLHVLNQIVNGEIRTDKIASFNLLDFKIENTINRIIVCSFTTTNENSHYDEDALSLLKRTHYPVPCEIWNPRANQVLLLFNDSSNDLRLSHDIAKITLFKLSSLTSSLIGIGIGDAVESLQKTSYSYNRALLALSYQMYTEKPGVHDPTSICDIAPSMSPTNIDYSQLTEAILASDYKTMNHYCETFFCSLFYVPQPPPTFIKGMCIYLVVNVLKDLNQSISNNFLFPQVSYKELNHLVSFSELKIWILSFFDDCCKISKTISSTDAYTIDIVIDKAKKYVKDNLLKNIRTKDIASFVNLSESYFTAYFKQKTGVNLRDYLLNCKIDYAKSRILEDKATISEIAYELSYTDYRSFSRAFKNVTSMTPSEYSTILLSKD